MKAIKNYSIENTLQHIIDRKHLFVCNSETNILKELKVNSDSSWSFPVLSLVFSIYVFAHSCKIFSPSSLALLASEFNFNK